MFPMDAPHPRHRRARIWGNCPIRREGKEKMPIALQKSYSNTQYIKLQRQAAGIISGGLPF